MEEERRRAQQQAAIEAQAAALRDAGIRQLDDDVDPSLIADVLAAAGVVGVVVGKDGRIAPRDVIRIAEGTHKRGEVGVDELVRGSGPDAVTLGAVKNMLAMSVKNQHGKWETNSRARIANVWREAHLAPPKKRDATAGADHSKLAAAVPGYPRGFYSPHELHGGDERPVEVYHGLRNPQSARAAVDDDPLAARRAAPPGGNLDMNRPGSSRPKLLRPRAADVFVRDEPQLPGPSESIVARTEERGAAALARAEHTAMTSRKYFGTESFRRPETIKRRRDLGADSGSTYVSATSASTSTNRLALATRSGATVGTTAEAGPGAGGLGPSASGMRHPPIPERGVPARVLDAALRAPPVQRSTAPTPSSSAAPSRRSRACEGMKGWGAGEEGWGLYHEK